MQAATFRWLSLFVALCVALPMCAAQQAAKTSKNEILTADDLIEVKVFQEDDLTTRARISHGGTIAFPLLGSVAVSGRTPQEAGELIQRKLAERFLVNPQVNLTVLEHARKLFTVLGQVQRAGTYKFPDRESLNLIQAIGMAGGYTRLADATRITVKRVIAGRETVLKLDARGMAREGSKLTLIEPGDMITVGERLF